MKIGLKWIELFVTFSEVTHLFLESKNVSAGK